MRDEDRGFWELVSGICIGLFGAVILGLMIYGWIIH